MTKHILSTLLLVLFSSVLVFGGKPHANEKLIAGKWKPVKVEQIADPSGSSEPAKQVAPKGTKPGVSDSTKAMPAQDTRQDLAVKNEQRAVLEISPDHTAVKFYHKNPLKVTWKLKSKGTKILAKNIQNGEKYMLNIVSVNETELVILEKIGTATLKVTYTKEI